MKPDTTIRARTGQGLPKEIVRPTKREKLGLGASTRRVTARSESRDAEIGAEDGMRQGEDVGQVGATLMDELQQQCEEGLAKMGKELPTQARAASRTTNFLIFVI